MFFDISLCMQDIFCLGMHCVRKKREFANVFGFSLCMQDSLCLDKHCIGMKRGCVLFDIGLCMQGNLCFRLASC